jgi:hypothetical protein
MVVRKNVLEYIIALVVVKNKVRLKKGLKKFQIRQSSIVQINISIRRAEGGAKIFGVFRVKNHDFTPKKSYFFPILG